MSETEKKLLVDSSDLTTGSITRKLMQFFWPIMMGLLFQQLYTTVDAVIVGRYLGSKALAAVGGGTAVITQTIIGFFVGLNSGATVMIAQYFGANKGAQLERVLHTFISFCLIVGVILTGVFVTFTPAVLRLINTPEDIMLDSVHYLRIYFLGSIPMLMYNLFQGTMQAVGNSKSPLRYLMISFAVNVVLDVLFVAIFHWGVIGAAGASVISMMLCMILAGAHLSRANGAHRISFSKLCLDGNVLAKTLRIGLPAGLESSMYEVSNLIIQAGVNSFGSITAAAWTATSKLDGFYWVTTSAFGAAICAFVGQCYGAGNYTRMRQAVKRCMFISLGVTVLISAGLIAVSRPAYQLFLTDKPVVDSACSIMMCFVPYYFIWSYIEVLTGSFRGTGDTFLPMVITMVGTCFFRILWMYIVIPKHNTIESVGIVYPITWVITGLAFAVYYFRRSRLRKAK